MKRLPLILLLVLLGGFLFGLAQLFKWRFEAGDVFPEYSSLRTDPLGAKALYESLDHLLTARRNYRSLAKLGDGRDTTLFYLGSRATFMFDSASDLRLSLEEFKSLESFVADGGRLVISLFPSFEKISTNAAGRKPFTKVPPTSGKGKGPGVTPKKGPIEPDDEAEYRTISIRERWGLEYDHEELLRDPNNIYKPAPAFKIDPAESAKNLPALISCHTALFFDKLTNFWRAVYVRKKDRPVIIERKFGAGAIVLCADSYFFSNEALLKERYPALLAWMVGPSRRTVFDETHLGVEESPGVSALARKYRLHGLFAGLLVLAGLFVWKNATSFMPPYSERERERHPGMVAGKDSAAGFVNLLRRNLPAREVLAVCLSEWKKSCGREQPRAKLEQVQAVIDSENQRAPREQNPIETYRAISRILDKSSGFQLKTQNSKLETRNSKLKTDL